MIQGIGADIVEVARIARALERHGNRFAERILRREELQVFLCKENRAAYLAKRFAAKEAASKALGVGIGAASWQDFCVANDELGAPTLSLSGHAAELLAARGASRALLSLADEKNMAMAFVVLTGE